MTDLTANGPDENGAGTVTRAALQQSVDQITNSVVAEIGLMGQMMETALAGLHKGREQPDYGKDFARLHSVATDISSAVEILQKKSTASGGGDIGASVSDRIAVKASAEVARIVEARSHDLANVTNQLHRLVSSARDRQKQNGWLWGVGAGALIAGVLLTLFLPRMLPGPVDLVVAATAMSSDRWDAGSSLMQSASPAGWRDLADASRLARANTEALSTCRAAAAKAGKPQSCSIMVSAPLP